MKRDLYAEVTARILAELETGTAPWVKPWSTTPGANVACNAVSKRPYSGINIVMLWACRGLYPTQHFVTFKQAKELGGHVRAGEHGFKVFFFKQLEVKDRDNADETKLIPMLREYTVFNVAQCEGLPARVYQPFKPIIRHTDERTPEIDEFLACTGADIREGMGEAYFAPGADYISMPAFNAFRSAAAFYGVNFHELIHWTGHKSRLDRDLRGKDGAKKDYAAEELCAELGAAFLCAEFDIDGDLRHATYIESWIKLLKDDNRAFFKAAARAQKAADYLRELVNAAALPPAKPLAEAA